MENIFLKILNISITASWLVLAVLLMRLVLKKAPRFLSVILWALVGIRLVLPFTFESVLSLIPSTETVPPEIIYEQAPQLQTGFDALNSAVNPVIAETFAPAPGDSVNPLQIITWLAGWIWILGMAAMAIYTLISCLRIHRKLRESAPLRENIYLCDRIDTPFIFGLFRPKIYLPSAMAGADIPYVLAHEQAHLKRRDHLWKPLGFLLLTVHWFNPLLWLAYILLCRDIEAACDEKVLQAMGEAGKKPYSQALVNCSVPRKMIAACPLAFGEVNVKSRIKKVLSYKKPAFWLLIAAVVVCVVLSVCFLTNPRTVNAQMQVFLDCQIAEHFQTEKSQGNACCLDYEILGTKKRGKTTTVYLWVLYEEYSYQNGQLQQETGSHIPTVITARKEDGNYRLVEYFEPRDGAYNPGDIKAKFPWYLWPKAMDSQRYYKRQHSACLELAEQYFRENPPSVSSFWDRENLKSLRLRYPQYFETLPETGMTVYVWQMAAGNYCWGLLPGGGEYTWDKSDALQLLSLDALHAIIDDYGLKQDQVTICPIQVIHSSYLYNIDEAYTHNVTVLFWSRMYTNTEYSILKGLRSLIDTVDYDIDGDGTKERCQLHYGPTSGLFTFGLVAYENEQPEYCNIYLSDWGYLSFVEKEDGSLCVQRDGSSQDAGIEIYDIVVTDGHIQLIGDVTALEYWGLQGVDYSTDPEISEDRLNTDLERLQEELLRKQQVLALREKYPQYFDLPTNNGLEVYVWQMAPGSYYWGLLPGRAVDYYETTLLDLQGASLEEIRIIVDSYGLDRSMISVCPIQMPYSSYYYVIDDAYRQKVEVLFWFGLDFDPDTFGVTVSYAGDPDTSALCANALNRDKMAISSVQHLPIFKFDTREEFEQFMWKYVNVATNSTEGWDGVPSFQTVSAQYDDAFFAENSLLLIYVKCGNCTYRFDVNSIFYDDTSLCVHVEETTGAEIVATAEANWFIAVAIPDTVADNCTTFDATLGDH